METNTYTNDPVMVMGIQYVETKPETVQHIYVHYTDEDGKRRNKLWMVKDYSEYERLGAIKSAFNLVVLEVLPWVQVNNGYLVNSSTVDHFMDEAGLARLYYADGSDEEILTVRQETSDALNSKFAQADEDFTQGDFDMFNNTDW